MTDTNKPQSWNASFPLQAQPTDNEKKTSASSTRLRPKTKLRGLPQENTFAINQQSLEQTTTPSRPLTWQKIDQKEQVSQSSSLQLTTKSTTNLNNSVHMPDNSFSSTTIPFTTHTQENTQQLGSKLRSGTTGQFHPINRSGNTGQLSPAGRSGSTGQLSPAGRSGSTGQLSPAGRSGSTGQLSPAGRSGSTGQFNPINTKNPFGSVTRQLDNTTRMLPNPNATGTLIHPAGEYSGDTGMLKLNQAVKVVRIPIEGRPGEFKTGILPVLDQSNTGTLLPTSPQHDSWQKKIKKNSRLIMLGCLILLIIFASGIYLVSFTGKNSRVIRSAHSSSPSQINLNATGTANVKATATFTASLLVSDSLAYNTRGWTTVSQNGIHRTFAGSAYHIRSATSAYFAPSVLLNEALPTKYSYSVDMQEVAGNNTSQFNYYGLLLDYNQDKANNPSFYLFCIVNQKSGSQYQFVSFDNKTQTKWSDSIWKKNAGKEFHSGKAKNTLMVQVDGPHFTFWANGVKLGTTQNKTFRSGSIGMGVNGVPGGAEVAFTNLILAQN